MKVDVPIRCSCGALQGYARGISRKSGRRMACYCDDCQSFAHFLGRADEVLDALEDYSNPTSQLRMIRMHGQPSPQSADLFSTQPWLQAVAQLDQFNQQDFPAESGDLFE